MNGVGAVVILAGIAGLYLWNLSKAAGNLTYFPGNITGFHLLPPTIFLELVIQNTSNIEFTINSLAANVTSDGTQIGNVSNFTPVVVPSNSQGAIPLTLSLQPIGLVNDIISIITGGNGSRTILIEGTVNANGMQQTFSLPFKVGV
jgi:LEA14-like dessication related protein